MAAEPIALQPDLSPVIAEWGRRAASEYTSAAHAQQLTLWLIQIAAPSDLIEDGLRVAADELAHARLCFEAHTAAGGTGLPAIDRRHLSLAETSAREIDVLRATLQLFCLGETLAVSMFVEARRRCRAPAARAALDRIVIDEPRHRAFGWDILDWYLHYQIVPECATVVASWLPDMIEEFLRWYPLDAAADDLAVHLSSWGLTSTATAARLVQRAADHDWRRRFEQRGIGYPASVR